MVEVQKRSNWCVPWNSMSRGRHGRAHSNRVPFFQIVFFFFFFRNNRWVPRSTKVKMHFTKNFCLFSDLVHFRPTFTVKGVFGQRFVRQNMFSAKDFFDQICFRPKIFFGQKYLFAQKSFFSANIFAKVLAESGIDLFHSEWHESWHSILNSAVQSFQQRLKYQNIVESWDMLTSNLNPNIRMFHLLILIFLRNRAPLLSIKKY